MNVGDLVLASSIVMSGNNFTKVALLAKFMNLSMISNATFLRMQNHYTVPVIKVYWNEDQAKNIEKAKQQSSVIVQGTGELLRVF